MSKPIEIDLTNQGDRAPAFGTALPGPTDPSPQAVSAIRRVSTGARFTPGPWAAEEVADRCAWIKGANGNWAALAYGEDDDTAVANRNLIAAAPELYAILLRYRNETPLLVQGRMVAHEADAVLAKAQGK